MNRLRLTLLAAALTALAWAGGDSLQLEPGSKIWIEGTSTVHDWTCQVEQLAGALDAEPGQDGLGELGAARVTVPVQGIDCDNGTMDGKLRDALKASSSPAVRYTLTRAEVGAPGADGWFTLDTTGRLSMAGATRNVAMEVRGKALGGGRFRFTGQLPLRMTDFGIDPPTALLGALKTGDQVTVHFDVTAGR